jgi:hypothetical protein
VKHFLTLRAFTHHWVYYLCALLMCLCYFRTVLTEPGRVHPHRRDELILMPFKKEAEIGASEMKEGVREARELTAIAMSPANGGEQMPQQRIGMRTVMSAGCSGQESSSKSSVSKVKQAECA